MFYGDINGKGKVSKWLEPENLTLLEGWAKNGLTDEQIAHNMGISARSLYKYKELFPQILLSLKKGKEVVDTKVLAKGTKYTEICTIEKGANLGKTYISVESARYFI